MQLNYKRIGDYVKLVDKRNKGLKINNLIGLSISKEFIKSVSNTIGTDMENYKILEQNQFACSTMQVRRDRKMPIALYNENSPAIISPAYPIFKVTNTKELLPKYLMMWFERKEFDREACFHAVGGVRGSLEWEDFCDFKLPVPTITKQQEIVCEYNTIQKRIELNQKLITKLEETAQAIYKQWFVDFDFPDENGKPYKSSGGKMVESEMGMVPEGWKVELLKNICSKISSGSTPTGGKESYYKTGISLIRSTNVYDYKFFTKDLAFINNEQANKLNNVTVYEEDVLFNITGVSVARCCMVPKSILPARVNQHVMIIRAIKDSNMSFYILMKLCSNESKNKLLGISQSGSTREAITKAELEGFKIIKPIDSILKYFYKQMKIIFQHKDLISQEVDKLSELQSLLLSKLATINN